MAPPSSSSSPLPRVWTRRRLAMSLLLLWVILPNDAVAESEDFCSESVCEYYFHYQKVMSMTWHTLPSGYPQQTDTRVWERSDGGFYILENDTPGDPNRREVPVFEQDFLEHRVNVLDGRNRLLPSINGRVPGPTIEVNHDTRIVVHVSNEDFAGQSISIHWHGMFQVGTPFYDGIGGISQCHTLPGNAFTYDFTANPWGTFWYHAHTGVERTDGVYGALIIHERQDPHEFLYDHDHFFTFVTDWYRRDSLDYLVLSSVGVYNDHKERYVGAMMDGELASTGSSLPFEGGLFNDKGQHFEGDDIVGEKRFYQYDVKRRNRYRFRFICSSYIYAFRISFDSHSLTLISADGFDIAPIPDLESIMIYSGERLDVIVTMDQPIRNYWVRATTMEKNDKDRHEVKAVLHYEGAPSPKLIPPRTSPKRCTIFSPCVSSPCMWSGTPMFSNRKCIPTNEWKNIDTYPDRRDLLKDKTFYDYYDLYKQKVPPTSDRIIFQNWGAPTKVDGISYRINSHPTLFNNSYVDTGKECPMNAEGDPTCPTNNCVCVNKREMKPNTVVDFVWYSLRQSPPYSADYETVGVIHPIHTHGMAFYILAEGLPTYNNRTGLYEPTRDIQCRDEFCTKAEWVKGFTPKLNLGTPPRRDTYSIAPGAWAYVRLVMDNPGNWAVHCHLETHTATMLYTMFVPHSGDAADPLNFDVNKPAGFPTCGNFNPLSSTKRS